MFEQRKANRKMHVAISVVLLLCSTITALDFLQFNSEALAAEQLDIVGNTSGNNAPSIDKFNLTSGYSIEPIVWNLTAPDTSTFDDNGTMYIGEAGYPFTDIPKVPRILKVTPSGNISVFVDRNLNSPIVDVVFHKGLLYVSDTHKISTVNPTCGSVQDIIVGLPSTLTHPNNQIAPSIVGLGTG